MAFKHKDMIRRACAILLGEVVPDKWEDVVAVRFIVAEGKAKVKELEKVIPHPEAHTGPYSGAKGQKPKPAIEARNAAAKTINDGISAFILLGKSLRGMRIFELQKIAASASETAALASALLSKIGANADPTALVTDALNERQIKKVFSDKLGKRVKEYRDMASYQM